jgi:CheY-like chemotaxis protein
MPQNRKLTFFVVDDDPDVLAFARGLLEAEGHTVFSLLGSESALSQILAAKPDCVLIDLMMPGTDGLALCKQIRERQDRHAPCIVIVSGKVYEADRQRAYEIGASGYLVKPLDPQTFVATLYRFIDDEMEVTFWGVRGTLPVPGEKTLRYGGNTSCVSLEFASGAFFIFDAGTGIKTRRTIGRRRPPAHGRQDLHLAPALDHINALPFFGPLYIPATNSRSSVRRTAPSHGQMISAQMDGVFFPIRLKQFGARVYFRDLEEKPLRSATASPCAPSCSTIPASASAIGWSTGAGRCAT